MLPWHQLSHAVPLQPQQSAGECRGLDLFVQNLPSSITGPRVACDSAAANGISALLLFNFTQRVGGTGGWGCFQKLHWIPVLVTAAVLGIPVFLYIAHQDSPCLHSGQHQTSHLERKQETKMSSNMLQNDLRQHNKSETLIYHSCIREKGSEGGNAWVVNMVEEIRKHREREQVQQ